MWPQLIFLGLIFLGLGIHMALHGQPQKRYNAWTQLAASIISVGILYWGGFFNCFFN